jgi:caa(3)-type oxidase subunit IV
MAATTTDAMVHGGHDPDVDRTKQYILVAVILAVFTALEVSTYWMTSVDTKILTVGLLILMVIKFATVTAYFMHLKFDKRLLTVTFYSGLVLALLVYLAILTAFRFWGPVENHMVQPTKQPAGTHTAVEGG